MNEGENIPKAQEDATPTDRFSDRVANYVRYRPGYPSGLSQALMRAGVGEGSQVADIGSETGISAELILDLGCHVYAVEPNGPMREAAEAKLGGNKRFHSIAGTAESTT